MPLDPVSNGDPHVPAHNAEREAINSLETALGTKITLPGGLATGDLLLWDGSQIVSSQTRFFEGHGNPNGVVAAPVGSRYVDMDATRGAVDWVKSHDGDTNTGWTSSIGALAPIGQVGTITVGGAAGKSKTRTVPLDPAIFLGGAPRVVLLTASGYAADISMPYVTSKSANAFGLGVRRTDDGTYTSTATMSVDYFAII